MTTTLERLIDALRTKVPAFQNRVFGAAEFTSAFDDAGAVPTSSAWVVPLSDSAESLSQTGTCVRITEDFGVYVLMDASTDGRGQAGVTGVAGARTLLFGALLGWQPTKDHNPIIYTGGEIVRLDRARLVYQFTFQTAFTISGKEAGALSRQQADLQAVGVPGTHGTNGILSAVDLAVDFSPGGTTPDHEALINLPTT